MARVLKRMSNTVGEKKGRCNWVDDDGTRGFGYKMNNGDNDDDVFCFFFFLARCGANGIADGKR